MAEILGQLGYEIDDFPNVNYAGMEIDIEGKLIATKDPLYAECKCYETMVNSPKLQAFYGKYMAKWRKNKKCHGLFIALPGINSHAKGFYNESIKVDSEINFTLLEEKQVMEYFFKSKPIVKPDSFSKLIPESLGKPGDWILIYTSKGIYWVQYLIPQGGVFPTKIMFFDENGKIISDRVIIDYILGLWPELNDFEILRSDSSNHSQYSDKPGIIEEIVEVRGSSSCFEYQFPASPQHFVGRVQILDEIKNFVEDIINRKTSSRGLLFEGNSGWGKSSLILTCVSRLQKLGHFAVAIDSRSASSSQFILRVISYSFNKFSKLDDSIKKYFSKKTLSGFEGAVKDLITLGKALEKKKKILFIFLDQFENLFYLREALKRIRNVFLRVFDAQTNVIIGFSWKSDLIGLTNEFPYQIRDAIIGPSKQIRLQTFSKVETETLLKRLSKEIKATLRNDLKFFLSEFSQGYPWLLKKLCAHVKAQILTKKTQVSIANSLLNIKELFLEDIHGLSAPEIDSLKRIARLAPISIQELGDEYKPDIIQSLVHRRLIVKIGNKYDVYWDIFRDYLNTNRVPVRENYILRTQVRTVLKALKILVNSGKKLTHSNFQKKIDVKENTFYNVLKDMRLLGIVKVEKNYISLSIEIPSEESLFEVNFRSYLKERLMRNRLIWRIMSQLEIKGSFEISDIADILQKSCPYISAAEKTWKIYGRTIAKWIDAADLAFFNAKTGLLSSETLGETELRERHLSIMKSRGGINYPPIQYNPIKKIALGLYNALIEKKTLDYSGLSKSSVYKALSVLESFGFIIRKPRSILLLESLIEFAQEKEKRCELFRQSALKMDSFSKFIQILNDNKDQKLKMYELSNIVRSELNTNWKESTAKFYTKILLDWARSTDLSPAVYCKNKEPKRIELLDKWS